MKSGFGQVRILGERGAASIESVEHTLWFEGLLLYIVKCTIEKKAGRERTAEWR